MTGEDHEEIDPYKQGKCKDGQVSILIDPRRVELTLSRYSILLKVVRMRTRLLRSVGTIHPNNALVRGMLSMLSLIILRWY